MSHPVRKKTLLVILDGFGINPDERFNAIARAKTPNFDNWLNNKPNTTLLASGKAVGLPDGQMGSSEVGHSILGSGVVVAQELVRISAAIEDKSIFDSPIPQRGQHRYLMLHPVFRIPDQRNIVFLPPTYRVLGLRIDQFQSSTG